MYNSIFKQNKMFKILNNDTFIKFICMGTKRKQFEFIINLEENYYTY